MAGIYREKECPTCGTKHRKKGPYCSKTCSNKGRDDTYKEKMRDMMLHSDAGQVRAWQLNWGEESEPILPPTGVPRLRPNQFVSDGDIWTEDF